MARYLETLLRYRVRFLILLLIAPLSLGGSGLLLFRTFEATATVWVSDPSYLGQSVAPADWNPRLSAAQNATDTLRQLLATRAFDERIASAVLAAGVASGTDRSRLADSVGGVRVVVDGSHLVRLSFSNSLAAVATAVLRTTIAGYVEHETAAQQQQADISTTFLSSQVASADSAVQVAQQAVASYLDAHPALRAAAAGGDTGVADLDRLLHQLRQGQDNLAQLHLQLTDARYRGAAQQRLVETNTRVVDSPRTVDSGLVGDGRSIAAALAVYLLCLFAAAIYLAVLVWADRTARDGKELERRLHVPVLTTIPLINLQERF